MANLPADTSSQSSEPRKIEPLGSGRSSGVTPLWVQLLAALLLTLIAAALIGGYILRKRETKVMEESRRSQSQRIASIIAGTSLDAIISEDRPLLETIVRETGQRDSEINQITILNEERVVLAKWRDTDWQEDDKVFETMEPVIYGGEKFGRIDLTWDLTAANAKIDSNVAMLRLILLATLGGLGLVTLLSEAILVTRPLHFITDRLRGLAQGRFDESEPFRAAKELGILNDAVDSLGAEMQRSEQMASEVRMQQRALQNLNRHLNAEIERRKSAFAYTEELKESNQALVDFAYVTSHDLQEPLRKVRAFGSRIADGYSDKLDDKGRDYLDRMISAADRGQVLINDLLEFSRVSTQEVNYEQVNLDAIVRRVVSEIQLELDECEGEVSVGKLPTIEGHAPQLRQLFHNLIGNAVKYRKDGVPPRIEIRSNLIRGDGTSKDTLFQIEVRDNGIGFEQQYAERIFQIFQRLHSRGSYKGTGIGLAICRKIAERHDGTLLAESEPDKGTNFLFTVPVAQPPKESKPDPTVEPPESTEAP